MRLLFQFQHVEVHEACVLVLFFACELNEAHRLVEFYGRDIGIDGKETESGIAVVFIQQRPDSIDKLTPQMLAMIVLRNSKPTNFDAWVAAELLAGRKSFANLLPIAESHLVG